MVALLPALFLLFNAFAKSTHYVSTCGSDSSTCGSKTARCNTVNQVLTNYPGASYTISIAAGTYATTPIVLESDAVVIFQGTGNTSIITSNWISGTFLSQTQTSRFGLRDLTLTLEGSGSSFSTLNTGVNTAIFHNVQLVYFLYAYEGFIYIIGGSLVLQNVTLNGSTLKGNFIIDESDSEDSNITITDSSFANLNIEKNGTLLLFDAYGSANIVLNATTFTNITSNYSIIEIVAGGSIQQVSITAVNFSNTYSYLPSVYVINDFQCVIYFNSSNWNNATAKLFAGALEVLGSGDGEDHNITLNGLMFTNCIGNYAGALLVGYNSLNLSNSSFTNNRGFVGNDVVQGLRTYSDSFGYNITNSTSSSAMPRAVVWNHSTGSVTDISDLLPNPSSMTTRAKLSASPKFGRKHRRN